MRNFRRLIIAIALGGASVAVAKETPVIAIHGGAGTINKETITAEQEVAIRKVLTDAINMGYLLLKEGKSAETALVATIKHLEDSPLFNAGKGAVYTYNGTHELDAAIMLGRNREAGAVSGVTRVKNPIEAAFAVLRYTSHVMLSGKGADVFAKEQKLTLVDNSYFNTEFRRQQLEQARTKVAANVPLPTPLKFGTVGAVVRDAKGNLAAATSTGGMTLKRWGRIGDSPVIGAGTFADNNSCAISATGHGEYFIRYNVAADICARVQYGGVTLKQAADEVIFKVLAPKGGTGGVIGVDPHGNIVMPFNTQGMYRASIDKRGQLSVAIFSGDEKL